MTDKQLPANTNLQNGFVFLYIFMTRKYYSIRTKKRSDRYTLDILKRMFVNLYSEFVRDGYFDENFGYDCVDQGHIDGVLGPNVEDKMFNAILMENLWPIDNAHVNVYYGENDLFDVIEFLYDHVSKPLEDGANFHGWNNCGWHYSKFDKREGKEKFRSKINEIISNYKDGFHLSPEGEILVLGNKELEGIFVAKVPTQNKNVQQKIYNATSRYRSSRSNLEERRIAIRELADILEYLRPDAKKILENTDESDLFNLANNFAIRHHNEKQKTNYDKKIWYSWMFYYYLSTIHALLRLIERSRIVGGGEK